MKKFIRENWIILVILLLAFLLRLYFLSPWLGDWDSVLFSLSLHKFSLIEGLPQPPGYILYVLLGRVANFIFKNDTLSLTFLSAFLGSLLLVPFYFLCKKVAGKTSAILATILISITPIHVFSSISVFSEIPGEFFMILSAYLIYRGRLSSKLLLLGSFLAGISLGVRFAEITIVIPLLIVVYFFRKDLLVTIKSLVFFLLGILTWFTPLIAITGWQDFIKSYTMQATYIFNHDSFVAYTSLISRFTQVWKLFLTGYSIFFISIIVIIVFYFFRNMKRVKKYSSVFILVWLFSYLIPLLFIYNLEVTRFVLPLLAPISLLFAISIKHLIKNKTFLLFFVAITISIFLTSIDKANRIKHIVPPTVAPALYVRDKFDPNDTTLYTSYTFRQFQYYSPKFTNIYSSSTPQYIQSKYLITDYIGLMGDVSNKTDYQLIEQKLFEGPKDIFPRINKINLYIYRRL